MQWHIGLGMDHYIVSCFFSFSDVRPPHIELELNYQKLVQSLVREILPFSVILLRSEKFFLDQYFAWNFIYRRVGAQLYVKCCIYRFYGSNSVLNGISLCQTHSQITTTNESQDDSLTEKCYFLCSRTSHSWLGYGFCRMPDHYVIMMIDDTTGCFRISYN